MIHVALIFGGPSPEHDVSVVSAKSIYEAIGHSQIMLHPVGLTKSGEWKLIKPSELSKTSFMEPLDLEQTGLPINLKNEGGQVYICNSQQPDEKTGPLSVAFPIIHGPYGEDGKLQSYLNDLGLPFVGSDFMSCENSFDKGKTKDIMKAHDVPQVPYRVFADENPKYADLVSQLGEPVFVKPANMGSSVGISKVESEDQLLQALAEARIHDKRIIVESAVEGREIECALLEQDELKVSRPGEIKPNHEFYSYEAKYLDPEGAKTLIPAPLQPAVEEEIRTLAKKCFKALDCRDFARADFFVTKDNKVFFNEINTHPGCTEISLFPQLWQHAGMTYKDLVMGLIQRAVKRSTDK